MNIKSRQTWNIVAATLNDVALEKFGNITKLLRQITFNGNFTKISLLLNKYDLWPGMYVPENTFKWKYVNMYELENGKTLWWGKYCIAMQVAKPNRKSSNVAYVLLGIILEQQRGRRVKILHCKSSLVWDHDIWPKLMKSSILCQSMGRICCLVVDWSRNDRH